MNFELFNDKSKILINDSQNKAILFNHQQVLVEHLAYSIFQIEDNFLQDLFKEIKIDVNKIQIDLKEILEKKIKVLGENINIFFSEELIKVFENAIKIKDEFNIQVNDFRESLLIHAYKEQLVLQNLDSIIDNNTGFICP